MLSLRARITVVAACLSGAILIVSAVGLLLTLNRSLTDSSDRVSKARLGELAAEAALGELPSRLGDAGNGVVQVVAAGGRVVAASTNVAGYPPITEVVPKPGELRSMVLRGAPDDQGTEDYRVWARTVTTPAGEVTIYVGDSLESVREATTTVRQALLVGLPATLGLLVASSWLLVGRALRPVEAIRAEVASIGDDQLDRRVPVPRSDDEVGRLARTMNGMLARLDRARTRERDFVADASHELLSPLAASRAYLEVGPGGDQPWQDVVPALLAENATMEALVRDLLFLAEAEQGQAPLRTTPVDLDDLLLEEIARLRPLTHVAIDASGVSAAPVRGHREQLRRVIRNLLENAVRHANAQVRVTAAIAGDQIRVDLVDDGPGIKAEDRELIFGRFYRTDSSRARTAGGSGLGLSIARTITERHHGAVAVAPNDPGAHFVLTLPVDRLSGGRP
jgi:signal transduction histidine kinase